MPIKLGEMLVKAGLVKAAALDDALKSQVIFGGRLGTNLIEMGRLGEEDLARVLSEKLRVPYVDPRELMNVSTNFIDLIPAELAEKYQVVPLRLEGRRLSIAMADPSDLPAIDDIAFRTGYVIRPMVTPEIRLFAALEKYYGIRREVRYLPVSRELGGRRQGRSYGSRTQPDDAGVAPREVVDFSTIPGDEAGYFPWGEEAEQQARAEAVERCTVDTLSRRLAEARDRDSVAAALVEWAGEQFERAALFVVMRDAVSGWEAVAGGKRIERFSELRIGLAEPSVFQSVASEKGIFMGSLPETPANRRLAAALGGGELRGLILVPMIMNKRVVTILGAAGAPDRLGALLGDLRAVARKGVMAFEILILKNKILMT